VASVATGPLGGVIQTQGEWWYPDPKGQYASNPASGTRTLLSENDVTPMTPWLARVWTAIDRLAELPDNADGYKSRRLHPFAMRAVRSLLRIANRAIPPQPEVVPSPLGGIDLVWWNGERKLELIVDADGSISYFSREGDRVTDGDLEIGDEASILGLLRWFTGESR
jgi:hypothetical protein